jgi:phosphoglycolate phosphatase-like HAD superfamily hydrolase
VVWDWNSTLFDDYEAVVAATNDSIAGYGVPPLTGEELREVFYRPLDACFSQIIGRTLEQEEWEAINQIFHDSYHQYMLKCQLTPGAVDLLETVRAQGKTQSLLSMWLHGALTHSATEFGIAEFFTQIDGRHDNYDSGGKYRHLIRHLERQNLDPATVLVIGDTADDGLAAKEVGARAVLYSQGSSSIEALKSTGFPVVPTLADAIEHAY